MIVPSELCFCTAGIPVSAKNTSTEKGLIKVKELGLDGMELEFVFGINLSEEKASAVKRIAQSENLLLTAHAPYYINLNARSRKTLYASMHFVIQAARRACQCGAFSLCFHPGAYLGDSSEKAYAEIRRNIGTIAQQLREGGINIWVRPETTGKKAQFGTFEEILRLSEEIEGVMPCIDFSHLHARTMKNNSYEEFCSILSAVEKRLGKEALKSMHMHISGIEYSERGERYHLVLDESDMRYNELLSALKDFHVSGALVCESPNIETDALMLKKAYQNLTGFRNI